MSKRGVKAAAEEAIEKGFDIAFIWKPIDTLSPPRYTERYTYRISGVCRSHT